MPSHAGIQSGTPPDDVLSPTFPVARVPKGPVLGWSSFSREAGGPDDALPANLLDLPHKRFVTSARVAIALALQRLGVGPGHRVLVPSYHCLSMVEPIVFCGAEPMFFPLTRTLEVPLDALAAMDLSRVRAILVTHYFGFPQAMAAICAFAAERGIPVVEDCAHAIFGYADGRPIGSWGDYAAASLMKFFPVYDGGCLVSARNPLDDIVLEPPSRRFEVKALFNAIELGLDYERFPGIQLAANATLRVKDTLWRGFKRLRSRGHEHAFVYRDPAASEGTNGFSATWLDRRMSVASQHLVEHLPLPRIVSRRRRNYRRLSAELRGLPGAHAVFDALPDGVVPYVFPFRVDRPERVFARLKNEGVPIFRWERPWSDAAVEVDAQAARRALEIFQFPCHQELSDDDLSWIIERIRAAFADAPAGAYP